ncbi:MAG: protein-methionine-sulfoxide reductase catalytic subunit MsrP [Rhodobacteraceae bacterium]|nr:protein-methionine-sulfoxide reductase catalytic subunit MsrP [Paracoccaceae bacterium]
MAHRWTNRLTRADVTPYPVWLNRRQIVAAALGASAAGIAGPLAAATGDGLIPNSRDEITPPSRYGIWPKRQDELMTNSWDEITGYNNFYEFGTGKDDPKRYAGQMTIDPWSIRIDGLVDNPGTYELTDILADMIIEERIYRFRCVERWAMVIPWNGFELADLLNSVGVQPGARYVAFETLLRPSEMPGVRYPVINWPYVEGLRLDEALHPLTLMATGIYDRPIANQNGAPIRLVVPWKYGYKSIKSIVRITLVEDEPPTAWNTSNATEYGFYSNVNPNVDHPRWSQAWEQRVGSGLFARRTPTLMFNGYEEEVASLYDGMDLSVYH